MQQDHQAAAVPLRTLSPANLLSILKQQEADAPDESEEARENRTRAGAELAMMFELSGSQAFKWFAATFIEQPFRDALEALKSPTTKVEELEKVRTRYLALREIRAAVIEREIAHRELISPADSEIPGLRARLALL